MAAFLFVITAFAAAVALGWLTPATAALGLLLFALLFTVLFGRKPTTDHYY